MNEVPELTGGASSNTQTPQHPDTPSSVTVDHHIHNTEIWAGSGMCFLFFSFLFFVFLVF